jgi:hypothetical protein
VISKVCVYNRKKKNSVHTIVKGGKLNVYLDNFPFFENTAANNYEWLSIENVKSPEFL